MTDPFHASMGVTMDTFDTTTARDLLNKVLLLAPQKAHGDRAIVGTRMGRVGYLGDGRFATVARSIIWWWSHR
jgi:hypothetical protein